MIGGQGNDTYTVDSLGDVVTESDLIGIDTILSSTTYTLGVNVENLTLTGPNAINGKGNSLANLLTGNDADNNLDGDTGLDTMVGGKGNDIYTVDTVGEVVTENAGNEYGVADTVLSSITYTLVANVENLTLTGALAINGIGNSSNNRLIGNGANNSLNGGAGADTMIGGAGNDTYTVNQPGDIVTESTGEGTDKVLSSLSFTLGENVENLTLTNAAAVNGTGNSLNNTIIGNSNNNILRGMAGNDILTGGAGQDIFVFDTTPNATSNMDIITDFTPGTDTIQLENTGGGLFTALPTGTLALGAFNSGAGMTAATQADDRIIYNSTSGALFYDADGTGAQAAIQIALLGTPPMLTNTNFMVV
jgi:Ca2+-binding RTX toxin-like protein